MSIPLPPDHRKNRDGASSPALGSDAPYTPPVIQETPVPEINTVSGRLTEDETSMILRTTLLPEHREDPNILRFIASYLKCRDVVQAAREAGLHGRAGHNLRQRPDVHLAITRLTEKSVMKYGFDASEVIERVKELVSVDPLDYVNPDGTCRHLRDMSPEARRAIKKFKAKNFYEEDANGMKVLRGEIIEIELYDKVKPIELLGREKELFKETKRVEHDITSNMATVLLDSTRRAEERVTQMIDVTPAKQITGGSSE